MIVGLALIALLGLVEGQLGGLGVVDKFNPDTVPRMEMSDFFSIPSDTNSGFGSFAGMTFQKEANEWFTLSNHQSGSGGYQYFSVDGRFAPDGGLTIRQKDAFPLPVSFSGQPSSQIRSNVAPRALSFGNNWLYFANNNFAQGAPRVARFTPKTASFLDNVFIPHTDSAFATEGIDTITVGSIKFLYVLTNTKKVANSKGDILYLIEEWVLPGSVLPSKSGPVQVTKLTQTRVFPYYVQRNFFAVAIAVVAPYKIKIVEAEVPSGGIGYVRGRAANPVKIVIFFVHLSDLGVPSPFNMLTLRGAPLKETPKFLLAVISLVIDKFSQKALIIFTDFRYKSYVRYVPTFFAHKTLPFFNGLTVGPPIGGKSTFMLSSQNNMDSNVPSAFLFGTFSVSGGGGPFSDVQSLASSEEMDRIIATATAGNSIEKFMDAWNYYSAA